MSLNIYQVSEFEKTHEREQFDALSEILKKRYDTHEDVHLLIANPSLENKDIDAVFIKRDAITVIEMKNYGGKLSIAENGDWTCGGSIVKGGSNGKNPYMQVKLNKTGLCSALNTWFYKPNVNLGHVSGVVLFYQDIEIEKSIISPQVSTWFKVSDMRGVGNQLHNITSQSINYSNNDLIDLVEKLHFSDRLVYKSNTNKDQIEKENTLAQQKNQNIILPNNLETLKTKIQELGYQLIIHFPKPGREGKVKNIEPLELTKNTSTFLHEKVSGNIWEHQFEAIEHAKNGENVCLATSTSSGKSYVFYSVGIEILARNPNAKIIASYPLKALSRQQEEKWRDAIQTSGLRNISVGRIDGDISGTDVRRNILNTCSVLIINPDTIHTFLMGKLNDQNIAGAIKSFLSKTELIILDEVHSYTGVFGSNSAYLYRRLNHVIDKLRGSIPQYIAASATIFDPESHLHKIVGLDFYIVSDEKDTSPKKDSDIILIEPISKSVSVKESTPESDKESTPTDIIGSINNLVTFFVKETEYNGITFLDSRKMVEQVSMVINRQLLPREEENEENIEQEFPIVQAESVLPYRAGFEVGDSTKIQQKLQQGGVRNIISTSALEMGIDIPHLDLAILLGIPYSSTSFYQRIGRVGRIGCKNNGLIIIINDSSVRSRTIFKDPKSLFEIPPSEGALYLENKQLQNIHAACFAEEGGEYDQVTQDSGTFETHINFPVSFITLCNEIRNQQTTNDYFDVLQNRGSYIQLTYPIRDLEQQYAVVQKESPRAKEISKGKLSHSQMLREAYPGAIYYYFGNPFRVYKVDLREHIIYVRREKHYFTNPLQIPTAVFPQFGKHFFSALQFGELKVCECELLVNERIEGYREKRGRAYEITEGYPIQGVTANNVGVYYPYPDFSRKFKTTGTIITHPVLDQSDVESKIIAQLIYEVFLSTVPFEKPDISCANNKFKENTQGFTVKSHFIAIYDQSYGGLHLTGRLCQSETIKKVFNKACELLDDQEAHFTLVDGNEINQATIDAVRTMRDSIINTEEKYIKLANENHVSVIRPQSFGTFNGHRVKISDVTFNQKGELIYKIYQPVRGGIKTIPLSIEEVESSEESEMGIFNLKTEDFND